MAIFKQKESVLVSSTSSIDESLTFDRGSVEEIGWNICFAWTWITLKSTDVINTLPSSCVLIHATCSARCTVNEVAGVLLGQTENRLWAGGPLAEDLHTLLIIITASIVDVT